MSGNEVTLKLSQSDFKALKDLLEYREYEIAHGIPYSKSPHETHNYAELRGLFKAVVGREQYPAFEEYLL